jgi:hypothetical protein
MKNFVNYSDHVILFPVTEYILRCPYGHEISHSHAYRNSTTKRLVKRPLENTARDERLTLDTAASRVTENDMGYPDSIPTYPEILACVKFSRPVLVPVQPPTARVPATTFLRKGGGGRVQQLGHVADNLPSSHDVIKIRRNFHPSPYVLDFVLYTQKKNLPQLFPAQRKAGTED